jgi:hypothetical protein
MRRTTRPEAVVGVGAYQAEGKATNTSAIARTKDEAAVGMAGVVGAWTGAGQKQT